MLIGIDASRCIADRLTGTERYSREIIAAMVCAAPTHRYRLYFREGDDSKHEAFLAALMSSATIEPVVIGSPRLWTHIGLRREVIARPLDALFVPAHVLPVGLPRDLHAVVTVHDVGYRRFPQAHPLRQRLYLDWGTRHSVRAANIVIADSHATAQDITQFYGSESYYLKDCSQRSASSARSAGAGAPAGAKYSTTESDKIRVAYPGPLPLADVSPAQIGATLSKFGIAAGQPFALHIGTLQPRKNLRRLIETWARAGKPDGALLVLAGGAGWGGENLSGVIDESNMNHSVKLLGYVSDEEKAALLRSARAYLLSSLYEGFGFPILEAQSVGAPVACSNTSSLPEVAGDGAQLFDPLNIDDMVQAIERVLCDDESRSRLIEAGRRNVERFSWDACARIVVGALEAKR